ncbi:MAG: nitrous oxide reductase accessory protein NosL [Thiobacillus sp.]|jgi:copper chaperone NosL|uniref:nitrous oxide reductase accessory protein NosL n=1 Tax=Thiobacillus sp. TaxID=924 RepID=UPI002894AEEC|nr:nitrous oxide reductase accessory protein NosL [Thiobacillus sp.]MDT3706432.1 nitrous oxide reductase accessory protein NosL [Thiobacillus sp.]
MNLVRPTLVLAVLATAALSACGKSETTTNVAPIEITQSTSCTLDGMLLADYPGPKAQIHYAGQQDPEFFCDTVEMFNVYLKPEQVRAVRGLFVQDMGKTDWEQPQDHWIDAKSAFYVHGSKRRGSMGPTIGSFALEADAAKFAAEYGGKVYRFTEITPDMVVLDGGALHDSNM